jgi:hypothetical protein
MTGYLPAVVIPAGCRLLVSHESGASLAVEVLTGSGWSATLTMGGAGRGVVPRSEASTLARVRYKADATPDVLIEVI